MSAAGIPLTQPVVAPGRAVKLKDGRIGLVDTVRETWQDGEVAERAYVVGIGKEFADWVKVTEIGTVYGVVVTGILKTAAKPPAYQPVLDALKAGQQIGFDWNLGVYFLTEDRRQVTSDDISAMQNAGLLVQAGYGYALNAEAASTAKAALTA